ncbi:MAG: type I restriction enzyme HsdR N-terminal domain-containing protein [Clostridiales bacterium]|nr:type I restriction enzyme HsdR N-terminal domain-containing protein [Clostridiales bacterium]MCI6855692.1 type I restriction enzyme HsdR N-terminal domain-containing protein [Bacillota bacterium]MDY4181909.1 type I restriction enzyme HsdR N-terminal domain-containing protein [Pseudoflavonifractor sp.]
MHIDLSKQTLPKIYKRNGKDCYLDPIRKKLIFITPEETVRQRVLSFLMIDLDVPPEMISVEEHLSHYGIKSTRRADIVIKRLTENDELIPIAVIECKAPGIGLGEKTSQQLIDYSELLGCDYAMMINDTEFFCYHYESQKNEYIQTDSLPNYKNMIADNFVPYIAEEIPERISFNKISRFLKDNLDEYYMDIGISPKTEHELACAAFNLQEGMLDLNHRFPKKQYRLFRLIEDYGVRMLSYGNAGGGVFYGPYRSFLIDVNGSAEFVSIGFSTYGSFSNPDLNKTAINVAVDNEDESHHSLQLVLDDNVMYIGKRFIFYHHGKIGISNKGSGKVSELREFVRNRYPQIISGNRFNLGELVNDRNWDIDDPEVVKLIENLISYALIRDEYRVYIKNRHP